MGRLIDLDKVEFLKVDGNIEFNHGVDCCINRLLKQPLVEAIPKDQYETRLKADMVAMLEDLDLQIDESASYNLEVAKVQRLIRDKINILRGETDE